MIAAMIREVGNRYKGSLSSSRQPCVFGETTRITPPSCNSAPLCIPSSEFCRSSIRSSTQPIVSRVATRGQQMSRSKHVFQVPELASLICSFSTTSDCAHLLRTNHALLRVTIPFIWGHFDRVEHHLKLIYSCTTRHRPTCIEIGSCLFPWWYLAY